MVMCKSFDVQVEPKPFCNVLCNLILDIFIVLDLSVIELSF